MSEQIEVKVHRMAEGGSMMAVRIDDRMLQIMPEVLLSRIADAIAERYVQEHYGKIAALLDQNAIANLAIADAGKKIAEEIRAKPTIIKESRTEVYQRGILGGVRRVR